MKIGILYCNVVIIFLLICCSEKLYSQLKVGDNPQSINSDAMLEIESSNKGLLLPRIALKSTTNPLPMRNFTKGMVIYNTSTSIDVTPGLYYSDGTKWIKANTNLRESVKTPNVITNAMLSQIPTQIIKGRNTAGSGNVEDLTPTQATSMLNTFSATAKGLVPASGGGTTSFLRADGTFASPSGTAYRTFVTTASDVINNNTYANTLADLTGLFFNVIAGNIYHFYAMIPYTSASTNTGSRWTINAPATTMLNYTSRYTVSSTSQTVNYVNAVNMPSSCNNTSTTGANLAIIEGVIKPSSNGTVQIRFASEIANSAITAKAGASLEYW